MIRHRVFLLGLLVLLVFVGSELVRIARIERDPGTLDELAELVGRLQLTDFALWSEARYARHPSQADWFTPHQDFPGSLEHFPAGSLIAPAPVHPDTRIEVRRAADTGAG